MNWEKNKLSFCSWLVFAIAVGAGVFYTMIAGKSAALYMLPIYLVLSCVWFVGGLFATMAMKRFIGGIPNNIRQYKKLPTILEWTIVLLLIGVGVYISANNISQSCEGREYFEVAKVVSGRGIPQIVHGTSFLYLYFLHTICLFFGNHLEACLVAQIILYFLSAVVIYRAVRKAFSTFCATVVLAVMIFASEMAELATSLSPQVLFLFLYGIVFYLAVGCLKERANQIPYYLMTGVGIGILTYLDITGISLLMIPVIAVGLRGKGLLYNVCSVKDFLTCSFGTLASFMAVIFADSLFSGKAFLNILTAWGRIFCPTPFRSTFLEELDEYSFVVRLLCLGLIIAVISCFTKKEYEKYSVVVGPSFIVAALYLGGFTVNEMDCFPILITVIAVLCGVGLDNLFDEPERIIDGEEYIIRTEKQSASNVSSVTEPEIPKVQLIENPLPLPKKHVSKVMDYDIEVADDDDYDIP